MPLEFLLPLLNNPILLFCFLVASYIILYTLLKLIQTGLLVLGLGSTCTGAVLLLSQFFNSGGLVNELFHLTKGVPDIIPGVVLFVGGLYTLQTAQSLKASENQELREIQDMIASIPKTSQPTIRDTKSEPKRIKVEDVESED
jgi:ABC-type arginine transport system permease subunit